MIHSSWVWLAPVLRARSGSATLSDAIAAATAPRAMHTTAVTIEVLARREAPRLKAVASESASPAANLMIMTRSQP
jgi:hypothetical protein